MTSKEKNYTRFGPCGCGPDIVGAPCQSFLCAELNENNEIIVRTEDTTGITSTYKNYPRLRTVNPEEYGDQIGNYAPCAFKVVISGFESKGIANSKYDNCESLNGEYYCYKINNLYGYTSNSGSTGGSDEVAHGNSSRWIGFLCKKENYNINSICGMSYISITLYARKTVNGNGKYDIYIRCSIVDTDGQNEFYPRVKLIGEMSSNINFSGFGENFNVAQYNNFSNLNCFSIEDLEVDDLPSSYPENNCCDVNSLVYTISSVNDSKLDYFSNYSNSLNFLIQDYSDNFDNYDSYGQISDINFYSISYVTSPYYVHKSNNTSPYIENWKTYKENSGDYENISGSTSNIILSKFGRSILIGEQPRSIVLNLSGIENSLCEKCDEYNGNHVLINIADSSYPITGWNPVLFGGQPSKDYVKNFTKVDVELDEDLNLASHNSICNYRCNLYVTSILAFEEGETYKVDLYSVATKIVSLTFNDYSSVLSTFNLDNPDIEITDSKGYCNFENMEASLSNYNPNTEGNKYIPCINAETPCFFCYKDTPPESIMVSIPDNWVGQAVATGCTKKLRDCLGLETLQYYLKFYCGDNGKYAGSRPVGDFVLNRAFFNTGTLPNGLDVVYLNLENENSGDVNNNCLNNKVAFIDDKTWLNSCAWIYINNSEKRTCGYHPIVNWNKLYSCQNSYEVINETNPIDLEGVCGWDYMIFRIYPTKLFYGTEVCNGVDTFLPSGDYFVFELSIVNSHGVRTSSGGQNLFGGFLTNYTVDSINMTIDSSDSWNCACTQSCITCLNPDCICNAYTYTVPKHTSLFRKFIKFSIDENLDVTFPNGSEGILYGNKTGIYVDCENLNVELKNWISSRPGSACTPIAEFNNGYVWGGDSPNQYTTSDYLAITSGDGCGSYNQYILEDGVSYADKSNDVTITVTSL